MNNRIKFKKAYVPVNRAWRRKAKLISKIMKKVYLPGIIDELYRDRVRYE